MPARPYSSLSSAPPSSPPPFASHSQQFGAAQSPSEEQSHVSPTWTAPSPARTLGYSSPDLPPLPSFSALGQYPRTPSNAARNERTDTSYYTASWGSPYRHPPPPPFNNASRHVSTHFGSDDLDEEASTLQFGLGHLLPSRLELAEESPNRFNLEHLIPRLDQNASPVQFTLEHLIRSRLPDLETPTREAHPSGTTTRASDTNPTSEEWVRRFLETRWNQEANDWNSSSDTEASADKPEPLLQPPLKRGHKGRNTNKTLNQQDFWRHFSKDEKTAIGKMMASKYADADAALPPRQASEGPPFSAPTANRRHAQADTSPTAPSYNTPTHVSPSAVDSAAEKKPVRPSNSHPSGNPVQESTGQSFLAPPEPVRAHTPRVRKKVIVKGKGCIISIPRDIPRGNPGYPPKPMTEDAVNAKLQRLQSQGYDIRGFDTGSVEPHNRPIWPTEADVRAERENAGSRYMVRVAKLSEWKDYENSLLEAKLAALGVSMGGEEDVPLPMSRQTSSQHPGLPFSPPIPTSSGGSHHRMGRQGSIVSGHFPLGPSPGHMSRQSIASPAAFGNPRASMHMHRHSTFASPANFAQHAISPSGTWSPGGYFGSQDGRSGSPALNRPNLSGLRSPHSPHGLSPHQQFPITPTQKDDFLLQMQVQQQQLQAQMLQQQQQQLLGMRPSSTLAATMLAEVPEDEDEEDELPAIKHANNTAPEIAVPTPRGHRHNISENLEREAANEEYHLEEAIDKQFAEGGDFSTEPESQAQFKLPNTTANSSWEDSRTVLHQPQPHSRAHSLAKSQQPQSFSFPAQQNARADSDGARTNLSENTNPSLDEGEIRDAAQDSAQHSKATSQMSNSWKDNKFAFSKPGSAMHSKHTSKSSNSKLNVEAKEFKFNPAASFNPGSFSSGFNFAPASKPAVDATKSGDGMSSMDGLASSQVSAPTFKPDAPAFTPTAAAFTPTAPAFNPFAQGPSFATGPEAAKSKLPPATAASFPTGGFDFSNPPTFKPEAPVFSPTASTFDPLKTDTAPTSFSSKIFGDVNISVSDIIKPATRSKAVPIVRPDTANEKKTEEGKDREDASGRPLQVDGREKRARRDRADGDDVPKFALQPVLASQPLGEAKQNTSGKQSPCVAQGKASEDKENMSPDTKRARSRSASKRQDCGLQNREALSSHALAPTAMPINTAEVGNDGHSPSASDVPTPTTENPEPSYKKHGHKSSLSASAKPFEFKPQLGSSGYDFGFHVTKPSRSEDMEKSQTSPPRSSRSPATTFRPSDDGSFKTALESGRHARYADESESVDMEVLGDASFNDIDAVMKHMNEEGSDFGVERDDNSWEQQSSPHRTPHEFDRRDLQPNLKMRSDAPSPSPRRFNMLRHMQGSATSNQDPFDDERAVVDYSSPVHRLNNAEDVPVSDWDEGLLTEGEEKIQTRSRFFDTHVDEILGRLLQNRLGPLEQNLQGIHEALAKITQRPGRGRRSMSTNERLDSDADDEDDDVGAESRHRNRSPRKDKRFEKMRSIIKEALETHQSQLAALPPPALDPTVPERIREIVTDVLVSHQPPATPAEPVSADQIRAIVQDAIASTPSVNSQPVEPIQIDDIRSIVMEAFATHAPQPASPRVPEQSWSTDLKSIIAEAIAAHQSLVSEAPAEIPQPKVDMSEVHQAVDSLKSAIAQHTSQQLQADHVREVVDDAFKRQGLELSARAEAEAVQQRDRRIADLECKLKEATFRRDAEAAARVVAEARETDTTRLLKVTEEELALLQQAAREDEDRMRALKEERDSARRSLDAYQVTNDDVRDRVSYLEAENEDLKVKTIALQTSEEDLKQQLSSITAENRALSSTLDEHRLSADKWRTDIQAAYAESERLRQAVDQARFQAEEAARVREVMRSKFDQLQQDMVTASQQVAAERAQWQKERAAADSKYEVLSARIEAEGRTRERLERELERLETQEHEGMKLRIHLEQTQKHNARLEEAVDQLRRESLEHQKNAERYERDMREARDAAHVEIRRTRVLMDADIDAANNQVNIVRHELESEISRVRAELDQVRLDADTAKERHELDLEAASDAKKQAVHEVLEKNRQHLQEQQRSFERQLEHAQQEHARALDFVREDKKRAEAFHNDKLALADSKLEHFKDKIALLEEKLQVAKEAANAAIAAASKSSAPASSSAPSGTEKISIQALRESISVLQEQLQEREGRIESLERQLEDADVEAPAKLKERDTEINWLRELLGVRIDDLNDLINALAQPTFDRETVRDAAIRIRTNLQMEQSEKERLITGGQQTFPTLSSLSNFASPKAVQLAAAFGNWRSKGRGEAASALAGNPATASRNQTPSRAASQSGQSFLSGLMTPPKSNLRRTPDLPSSSSTRRPENTRSNSSSSHASTDAGFPSLKKQTQLAEPRTPPLMRKANYDQDADLEPFSESGFYEDESTMDGAELTPLALDFGRELSR
ncbi:hypothetical protein IAQ61_006240 [Plenodomus lingam]|nr:hypothetical protein IAQ61_006240 [Plenodomus lingam]